MSVRVTVFSVTTFAIIGLCAWPVASRAQADYHGGMAQTSIGSVSSSNDGPPRYDATEQYQLGLAALKAGKFHEAERDFDHAYSADRTNAFTLTMRGVARARQDNLDGAAYDFDKSLKMNPTQITALHEYGVILAKQGKTDKAKAQLGALRLQAEGCGDSCPNAAKLKDAMAAVQDAIAQSTGHS